VHLHANVSLISNSLFTVNIELNLYIGYLLSWVVYGFSIKNKIGKLKTVYCIGPQLFALVYVNYMKVDPSTGMVYLQIQIQHEKLGYDSKNRFSVENLNAP